MKDPALDTQREFWDDWNQSYRTTGLTDFTQRQLDMAIEWRPKGRDGQLRILEIGCGTGWLSHELSRFGEVVGMDLSPKSIAWAQEHYPEVRFLAGDFAEFAETEQFDYIYSADVIAHVADQRDFVQRVGRLLKPGGIFLLMTQNPFVWNRSSYLQPKAEGQLRDWPGVRRLRRLLRGQFQIIKLTSIFPGGNQGLLRVVNNQYVRRSFRATLGMAGLTRLYERILVGRELVVVARRTD